MSGKHQDKMHIPNITHMKMESLSSQVDEQTKISPSYLERNIQEDDK
jgi:hypothetical protein